MRSFFLSSNNIQCSITDSIRHNFSIQNLVITISLQFSPCTCRFSINNGPRENLHLLRPRRSRNDLSRRKRFLLGFRPNPIKLVTSIPNRPLPPPSSSQKLPRANQRHPINHLSPRRLSSPRPTLRSLVLPHPHENMDLATPGPRPTPRRNLSRLLRRPLIPHERLRRYHGARRIPRHLQHRHKLMVNHLLPAQRHRRPRAQKRKLSLSPRNQRKTLAGDHAGRTRS